MNCKILCLRCERLRIARGHMHVIAVCGSYRLTNHSFVICSARYHGEFKLCHMRSMKSLQPARFLCLIGFTDTHLSGTLCGQRSPSWPECCAVWETARPNRTVTVRPSACSRIADVGGEVLIAFSCRFRSLQRSTQPLVCKELVQDVCSQA